MRERAWARQALERERMLAETRGTGLLARARAFFRR
jgi:hypothetical protein